MKVRTPEGYVAPNYHYITAGRQYELTLGDYLPSVIDDEGETIHIHVEGLTDKSSTCAHLGGVLWEIVK